MTITANGLIITGDNITVKLAPPVLVTANDVLGIPDALVTPVFTYYKTRMGERFSEDSSEMKLRKAYFAVDGPSCTIWANGVPSRGNQGQTGYGPPELQEKLPTGEWPALTYFVSEP